MNMFRDLLIVALLALGIGLAATDPGTWTWAAVGGPNVVSAIRFLADSRPYSIVILIAMALALFMTRLKY